MPAVLFKDAVASDLHISTAIDPKKRKKRPVAKTFNEVMGKGGPIDAELREHVYRAWGMLVDDTGAVAVPREVMQKVYGSVDELPAAVKDKLKGQPKKLRQWMHVWNSAYAEHKSEARAFASAWAAVGKAADARSLKPMNGTEGIAHTPFPHDAGLLDRLRPDQVPRFLAALTDQDSLETRTVRLGALTSLQNRVDSGKVEQFAQLAEEGDDVKLPVIVRMCGRQCIADGHHRLAAAWLRGEKTATVRYKDIEAVDHAVKRSEPAEISEQTWSVPFEVAKIDADQQLVFGWASVSEQDGKLVVDKQGDIILPEELEQAAYDFVLEARDHGDMHARKGCGRLVESMMFTREKQQALGIDLGKAAWWVGFRVDDAALWGAYKRGERPEFSIGGIGLREPA